MLKRVIFLCLMVLQLFCVPPAALPAEITITQNQGINFGRILSGPGQSCTLDALTGSLTGQACYDMSGSKGVVLIKGDPGRVVDMEVIPSVSSNNLTFTPQFDGGGFAEAISLSGTGSRLVYVGGILETDPLTAPSSGPVTLTYTLRVNYQ